MSSLVLTGDTSGQVTISAPAVAGTNTLTLPALTGTVLTNKTAGTVLQVVSTTKTNAFSTTSTSFVDLTGLSVSITPTSATNNVMVFATFSMSTSLTTAAAVFNLVRNSTNISQPSTTPSYYGTSWVYPALADAVMPGSLIFLDSPATTSATTYKIQCRISGSTLYVNSRAAGDAAFTSTITVMEIAA